MNKTLSLDQAITVSKKINSQGKSIVLAGGCFDILHIGHITYLENAKKAGDVLFVFVESDVAIRKLKGNGRPINKQLDRIKILESLEMVDYVILLPENPDYDKLANAIKPDIFAVTKGDKNRADKERQAKKVGGKVVDVVDSITSKSTSNILKLLGGDL